MVARMLTDIASAGVTAKTGVQLHSADSYFLSQNKAAQLPARVNYAGCPVQALLGRGSSWIPVKPVGFSSEVGDEPRAAGGVIASGVATPLNRTERD